MRQFENSIIKKHGNFAPGFKSLLLNNKKNEKAITFKHDAPHDGGKHVRRRQHETYSP